MKQITSQDNKYIKLAASLKQKKHRDEEKMFLVEGKRAVAEALQKPELLESIFVDESLVEEYQEFVDLIPEAYMVSAQLMRHICCTETPQGIAAIMKTPVWSWLDVVNKAGLLILLDQVSDPGNMGSIFRTCWALGVEGVLMTKGCADPFSPKVVRSTMGALLNIPVFRDIPDIQLDTLHEQGYAFICTDLNAENNYYSLKYPDQSIIIIGSEAIGASVELKRRCDRFIKIPMNPQVDSLNVAAACAIIVAEVARQSDERTRLA
ncbi:MAG: RNA methyltransferase [Syntrophomonas sp.]|nr:RNA methyltransferase [Syntrophomonas sp.]